MYKGKQQKNRKGTGGKKKSIKENKRKYKGYKNRKRNNGKWENIKG